MPSRLNANINLWGFFNELKQVALSLALTLVHIAFCGLAR